MDHKNSDDKEKQAVNGLSDKEKGQVKPYNSPKLKEFGSLTELTAAGSGVSLEPSPGQGPTSKKP